MGTPDEEIGDNVFLVRDKVRCGPHASTNVACIIMPIVPRSSTINLISHAEAAKQEPESTKGTKKFCAQKLVHSGQLIDFNFPDAR
jgi:hypothetical protein